MIVPRPPDAGDLAPLLAVAAACDQTGPLSVCEPRYLAHLRHRGEVLVSGGPGAVVGYAGLVVDGGASYLTDLFVHPDARGAGHGSALLAAVWDGRRGRAASSSQDPRALASYARYGARPRWPLLYLRLAGLDGGPEVAERDTTEGDAGWRLGLEGLRTAEVEGAVAAVLHSTGRRRVLRAATAEPLALIGLVDGLRGAVGSEGVVSLVVPGPHPALPELLARGARVVDLDLWCAADDVADLVDPVHELPSPAFG